MDEKEKVIELELEKVRITLQGEKEIQGGLFKILVGVATFLITFGWLASTFKELTKSALSIALKWSPFWQIILFLILVLGLPLLTGLATAKVIAVCTEARKNSYNQALKSIDKILKSLKKK